MKKVKQVNDSYDETGEPVSPGETDAAGEGAADGAGATSADVEALLAERDRLLAERAQLNDQLLRRRAEFDNFRKRTERERQEAREYASMHVIQDLLAVLDGLQRAAAMAPEEHDEIHEGVRLLARQFEEALERLGLRRIEATGAMFDPHVHQAVERVVTDEYPDQTVVEEWQPGYMFKDRLLRPAMVKVAVHPNASE